MKSFIKYLTESQEVNNRIQQVTQHLESKRRRIPTNDGTHLDAQLEAGKSPFANEFQGHGSKTTEGTVRLLHGMGDFKRGLHTMPWKVDDGAASGFGATSPYTDTPSGFIFHKSKPHHAIGMYVHPESGLQDHYRKLVPPEFPVIGTHEIRSFLDASGKKINKDGVYEGPKIDLFGRTRPQ